MKPKPNRYLEAFGTIGGGTVLLLVVGLWLFELVKRAVAAVEDRWGVVRLGATCAVAALLQLMLWVANRRRRRAWGESVGRWSFYEEIRSQAPGSLPPPNPPPRRALSAIEASFGLSGLRGDSEAAGGGAPTVRVDVAIKPLGEEKAGRIAVLVRSRVVGLEHVLAIHGQDVEVEPGGAEEVLGPDVLGRIREIACRFPALRGGAYRDALFLEVQELTGAHQRASGDIAAIRGAAGDLSWRLLEKRAEAGMLGDYRGLRRRAGAVSGDTWNSVFEPLDSGAAIPRPLEDVNDLEIGSLGWRVARGIGGAGAVMAGLLVCLGALRVASSATPYKGHLGSVQHKDTSASIVLAMLLALLGVALQMGAVRVPKGAVEDTRARTVGVVILGIVALGGLGSCVGAMVLR